MNKIQSNAIANYLLRFWQIISLYIFIPIYLRLLGAESYGLIAFFTSILAIISIADAGISAAFSRKIAENGPSKRNYLLLISLEKVLSIFLTVIAVIGIFFAKNISEDWIGNTSNQPNKIQVICICLMILSSISLVQTNLYISGLMGLQKQISANSIGIISSLVRQGLVIVPLYLVGGVLIYFIWQFFFSILFLFISRYQLLKNFKIEFPKCFFSLRAIRGVIAFSSGMLILSVITAINTQLDKLVVSKLHSLEDFSYYSLSMTLGQLPLLVVSPLVLAMYPRLVSLRATIQRDDFFKFYEKLVFITTLFASIIATGLFFYSENILDLWLGKSIPHSSVLMLQIASLSNLLLALQMPPFYLSLAFGHSATNVKLGIVSVLLYVPAQIMAVKYYGLMGAPWPFLLLNIAAFIYLTISIHKKFYEKDFINLVSKLVLIPLVSITASTYFISKLCDLFNMSNFVSITFGVINGLLILIISKKIYEVIFLYRK